MNVPFWHFRELHNSALFFTDMSLLETKAAATREYMNKGQSKAKNPTEGEKKKNGDSAYQTEETVGYDSTMDSFQLWEFLQLWIDSSGNLSEIWVKSAFLDSS